jgi:hypothetical protein
VRACLANVMIRRCYFYACSVEPWGTICCFGCAGFGTHLLPAISRPHAQRAATSLPICRHLWSAMDSLTPPQIYLPNGKRLSAMLTTNDPVICLFAATLGRRSSGTFSASAHSVASRSIPFWRPLSHVLRQLAAQS